ncbi:MAG: lytic murein transglycosylase B, partial [Burkholderiaceae bacterium]
MSMKFFKRPRFWLPLVVLGLAASFAHPANPNHGNYKSTHKPKKRKVVLDPETIGEFANFGQWTDVAAFMDMMVVKHGFNKTELESVFRKTRYVDTTIQLMKPAPPGKPKNWQAYRARFVEPVRIISGTQFWDTHADALARAEGLYGVPAEIIVGILGVETIYGRQAGNFRVLDALTTLAFDYPDTPTRAARMQFFRSELENTLLFARDSGIDPFSLLGSYAGAIGWPQFMPSSIRQYAVDFDGDGKIDLRNSPVDAIGSIANFLSQHGWKRGEPIVFPATVNSSNTDGTNNTWSTYIGHDLEAKYKLDELKNSGVVPGIEPPLDMSFGLVDLQNGLEPTEYWLGTENFFAITRYNRSFFYAMSVVELGRAVRIARDARDR